jgi:asparaginyl-tRNA synthetase
MAEATYYIDEDVGADLPTQTGEESSPYKTLGFAVFTHGETHKFLARKSLTGEVAEGADPSTRLEWYVPELLTKDFANEAPRLLGSPSQRPL